MIAHMFRESFSLQNQALCQFTCLREKKEKSPLNVSLEFRYLVKKYNALEAEEKYSTL